MQAHWNAALQTLEGHTDSVMSAAFSANSKQVVSGSGDKTVRLWNAATGAALQALTNSIRSVAFSPEGKLLPILQLLNHWIAEGDAKVLWLPPDYRNIQGSATWNRNLVNGIHLGEFHSSALKRK